MERAIFLDRDGVIIENRANYVRSWQDVLVFPQALAALAELAQTSLKVIVVTNQSAVGRGLITLEEAKRINERLIELIEASGGRVDAVYMCPHSPAAKCDCRKPKPGLLHEAGRAHSISLPDSTMVGDTLADLQAGHAAGITQLALVKTGLGSSRPRLTAPGDLPAFDVFENLSEAVQMLVHD